MRTMRLVSALALILVLAPFAALADESGRSARVNAGQIGMALGHHHTWKLNFPAFFPMLELRAGYQVNEQFLGRMELGFAYSRITGSNRASFDGANLMMGHGTLSLMWTPRLGDDLHLNLGGLAGVWFTAMWGDDLTGASAGSVADYLESVSYSYGAVAGLEWSLSSSWALTFEVRYNLAYGELAGNKYNFGGLGVMFGFLHRMRSFDIDMPR